MKSFDFAQAPQETIAQVAQAGQKAVDASQKAFAAQFSVVQENTQAAFGLARSALDVRDADGFKSFWEEASRATREAFERSTRFMQDMTSQQSEAVQDAGKAASGTAKKR